MPRLLVVHHTPSPNLQALLQAVLDGASNDQLDGIEVTAEPALTASETAVLQADGYVLGTPANLGWMSGALKHFFDRVYYPCLQSTAGRPFGLYVHGNDDTTGAVRSVEKVTTGLDWRQVAATLSVLGEPSRDELDAAWELGATVAASLVLE